MAEPISALLRDVEKILSCFEVIGQHTGKRFQLPTADPGSSASRCEASAAASSAAVGAPLEACALAAGLESVRMQLQRARQAVQAMTAATASLTEAQPGDSLHLEAEAATAISALNFVATAVTTPASQDFGVEAAEVQDLLNQLTRTLSRWQLQRALVSAEAAREAASVASASDLRAVASSAVRAKEHVAMAIWAACLGGPQALQELSGNLDSANRTADGALTLLTEAAAAAPTGAGGFKEPPEAGAGGRPDAGEEVRREEVRGGAAAGDTVGQGLGLPHSEDVTGPTRTPSRWASSSGESPAGGDQCRQLDPGRGPDERPPTASASPPQPSQPSSAASCSPGPLPVGQETSATSDPAGSTAAEEEEAPASERGGGASGASGASGAGAPMQSPGRGEAAEAAGSAALAAHAAAHTSGARVTAVTETRGTLEASAATHLASAGATAQAAIAAQLASAEATAQAAIAAQLASAEATAQAAVAAQLASAEATAQEAIAAQLAFAEAAAQAAVAAQLAFAEAAAQAAVVAQLASAEAAAQEAVAAQLASAEAAAQAAVAAEAEVFFAAMRDGAAARSSDATSLPPGRARGPAAAGSSRASAARAPSSVATAARRPSAAAVAAPPLPAGPAVSAMRVARLPSHQRPRAVAASPGSSGSISSGSGRQARSQSGASGADAAHEGVGPRPAAPFPPAPDADVLRVAMQMLVQAAGQGVQDGELDVGALRMAVEALNRITSPPASPKAPGQEGALSDVAVVWAHLPTRCAALQLMSYTVQQMRALLASEAHELLPTVELLSVVFGLLCAFLVQVLSPEPHASQSAWARTLHLVCRIDTVQCLVAAVAEVGTRAEARLRGVDSKLAVAGAPGHDLPATAQEAKRGKEARGPEDVYGSPFVVNACTLLHNLLHCAAASSLFTSIGLPEVQRAFQGAFLRSQALEHMVRTIVLVRHAARDGWDAGHLESNVILLLGLMDHLLEWGLAGRKPLAVLADLLLSGPCVQHFLLLHAVSQLCAADGGPDYGLPQGARLSPVIAGHDGSFEYHTAMPGVMARAPTSRLTCNLQRHLVVGVIASSLKWWAAHRARPCSDRALRTVCERAAAAALAAVGMTSRHDDPASPQKAAGASGGSSDVAALCLAAGDAVRLALSSLECAVSLVRNSGAGSLRRLWAPVVQAVNAAALTAPTKAELSDGARPLRLLVMLPLPVPRVYTSDERPSADLTPVLAAGYTAALERTIRSEMRRAITAATTGATGELLGVLKSVARLLDMGPGLVNLLAHEEPTTAAALMSSIAKALDVSLIRAVEGGVALPDETMTHQLGAAVVSALRQMLNATDPLTMGGCLRKGARKNRTWLQHAFDDAASVPEGAVAGSAAGRAPAEVLGGACGASGGASVGREQAGDGDGASDWSEASAGGSSRGRGLAGSNSGSGAAESSRSGGGGAGGSLRDVPVGAVNQMPLLTCLFLTRWLPQFKGILHKYNSCPAANKADVLRNSADEHSFFLAAISLGVQAYLFCREAAAAQRPSEPAGPERSGGGDVGSAAATAAGVDADADAWEALLFGILDIPGLVRRAACLLEATESISNSWVHSLLTVSVVTAMQHVLVAFPRRGRRMLRMEVLPHRGSLLESLVRAAQRLVRDDDRAEHFLELVSAVTDGGVPTRADVMRLRASRNEGITAAAALLPSPRWVEEQLSLCGNVMCTNLGGDSEKALPLPVGELGSVRFCSEDCKHQHRRLSGVVQERMRL